MFTLQIPGDPRTKFRPNPNIRSTIHGAPMSCTCDRRQNERKYPEVIHLRPEFESWRGCTVSPFFSIFVLVLLLLFYIRFRREFESNWRGYLAIRESSYSSFLFSITIKQQSSGVFVTIPFTSESEKPETLRRLFPPQHVFRPCTRIIVFVIIIIIVVFSPSLVQASWNP